jgi:O-succinylbenzoic acid--CoA ligase
MLRWNHLLIDPAKPESFPAGLPDWLEKIKSFCAFWFSEEDTWYAATSGSTSVPKIIPLSRQVIRSSAEKSLRFFRHNAESEGFALMVPAGSAGGFMLLARAFLFEMDVLLLPPARNALKQASFPDDKKWFLPMLPLQFSDFLSQEDAVAVSRRFSGILLGGGDLPAARLQAISDLHCPVFHSYGMTETASHIAIRRIDSLNPGPFELLDDFTIRTDENDCLQIKSLVITGNRWLCTRDIAEILPDGRFYIRGRADFVINSGGLKIHPETEKSNLSARLPETLRDFELLGMPDLLLQEKMVMVFFRSSVNRTGISLIANIFNQISDKEKRKRLPRAFYCLKEERPVLEGGKTDFYALRKKIQDIEPLWEKPAKTA